MVPFMRDIKDIIVREDDTIKQAMKAIDRGSLKIAIVVDKESRFAGMVSDGDIRRGILKGHDIGAKVSEVMNRNARHVSPETGEDEIAGAIREFDIIGLPVLKNDRTVADFAFLPVGASRPSFFARAPHIR